MAGLVTVEKIGLVHLKKRSENGIFYLVYTDANSGKKRIESTKQDDINVACGMAHALNKQLSNAKMVEDAYQPIAISAAVREAVKRSTAKTDAHKRNLLSYANYFGRYLKDHHKAVQYLHQIKPQILYGYVDYLAEKKLKPKTIQHYIHVIQLTLHHYNNIYPEHVRTYRIKTPATRTNGRKEKNYLDYSQVMKVYNHLVETKEYKTLAAFCLGALAGMNLMEIASRKIEDIDFQNQTINIYDSKNDYRSRILPLHPIVMNALALHLASRKTDSEYLFQTTLAKKEVPNHRDCYRWIYRGMKNASDACEDQSIMNVVPKDVRKTFINLAVQAKCELGYIEAYVGHAAKTVLLRHYADLDNPELLKERVLVPVHQYMLKQQLDTKVIQTVSA